MFEIHIADKDMSGGNVVLIWCLDKELIEKAKKYAHNEASVVIVVVPQQEEYYSTATELRWVVPLKQGMEYIYFRRPGKNKILAFLVLNENIKYVKERYLSKIVNYRYNIFDGNGKCNEDDAVVAPQLEVDVPQGSFAKEPSAWEKEWVLWLLENKGVDQCSFRKRRIFAYTPFLQPLIFLANYFLKLAGTLISLLFGFRGFTLRFLLHPLRYDLGHAWDTYDFMKGGGSKEECGLFVRGSIFIRPAPPEADKDGIMNLIVAGIKTLWTVPFMPPVLALLYVFIHYHIWMPVLFSIAIFIMISMAVFIAQAELIEKFSSWLNKKFEIVGGNNDIEELICTGEVKKPKSKSIKLRFHEIKGKMCKPFAR